jgi:hypothetical protein
MNFQLSCGSWCIGRGDCLHAPSTAVDASFSLPRGRGARVSCSYGVAGVCSRPMCSAGCSALWPLACQLGLLVETSQDACCCHHRQQVISWRHYLGPALVACASIQVVSAFHFGLCRYHSGCVGREACCTVVLVLIAVAHGKLTRVRCHDCSLLAMPAV